MLDQTALNIALDLAVGAHGVPKGKVVRPSLQVSIQLSNQDRDRLEALMTIGDLVQLLPLSLDRLLRRKHIQVVPVSPFAVAVVPKRVSQKVQTGSLLPQVHPPRLIPIDLQLELAFQSRFDELDALRSHLFRQRHKIVRIAHQLDIGSPSRPLRTVKQGVEPVQIQVRQQRRGYPTLRRSFLRPVPYTASPPPPTLLPHRPLQPHPAQLQDRPVRDPHAQTRQALSVGDRIEIARLYRVIHTTIPRHNMT